MLHMLWAAHHTLCMMTAGCKQHTGMACRYAVDAGAEMMELLCCCQILAASSVLAAPRSSKCARSLSRAKPGPAITRHRTCTLCAMYNVRLCHVKVPPWS